MLDQVLVLNDADMVYILDNIWVNLTHKRYAKLFSLFESLSVDEHCEFFKLVGSEVFTKSFRLLNLLRKFLIRLLLFVVIG